MKNIQHVFFDLDRTLWDFEANSEATLKEIFSDLDLTDKLGVSDDEFIVEYKKINERFWTDYRNGVIGKETLRYARFEESMKFFGHSDRELASTIGEEYIYRSPRKTGLVDGAVEVLDYLKPKYQLHIITNGFDEVQQIKMDSSGLSGYFEQVITSEVAGAKKPNRIVFDFAAEKSGASATNSIMIGDHLEADIDGALGVGWKAVFYEPNVDRMTGKDFHHIHHLKELKEIL
ncbi:MAG: YjjG family noncanonical pyrimidine nucleotidase [Flavobacteriales bacterium]